MATDIAIILRTAVLMAAGFAAAVSAQQITDRGYTAVVTHPAFARGAGPRIIVDEAHGNSMTTVDRLAPFVALATADGFVVNRGGTPLSADTLGAARLLMISNAGAKGADASAARSAFTDDEIRAVEAWVRNGGALLLIADHMPMGGAAQRLAAAFGVRFTNAYALDVKLLQLPPAEILEATYHRPTTFSRRDGTLRAHAITDGGSPRERIDRVTTFTGQAFTADGAEPLLVFSGGFTSVFPKAPWEFDPSDRRIPAEGHLQGAVKKHGAGRAGFFGEAAMFTAQTWGPGRIPMGLNHPRADQNAQFVLNLLHWLAAAGS